jgi:pyridoxal phosphate enzyme (YggS family)
VPRSAGAAMLGPEEIRANLAQVEARVRAACQRAGRERGDVTLVAVTKAFPVEAVSAAIAAGATDVGENKVQEARDKKPIAIGHARWHLIGHLQSNKAKDAVRIFDVIQTIDTIPLAEKVAKAASAANKRQEVLLEVNIGREPQKAGADPSGIETLAAAVARIDELSLTGLMTIPPAGDERSARAYFAEMRKMRDALGLDHLSMGMTDDFEVAIEEGATIIRVGRAIFGSRG